MVVCEAVSASAEGGRGGGPGCRVASGARGCGVYVWCMRCGIRDAPGPRMRSTTTTSTTRSKGQNTRVDSQDGVSVQREGARHAGRPDVRTYMGSVPSALTDSCLAPVEETWIRSRLIVARPGVSPVCGYSKEGRQAFPWLAGGRAWTHASRQQAAGISSTTQDGMSSNLPP